MRNERSRCRRALREVLISNPIEPGASPLTSPANRMHFGHSAVSQSRSGETTSSWRSLDVPTGPRALGILESERLVQSQVL